MKNTTLKNDPFPIPPYMIKSNRDYIKHLNYLMLAIIGNEDIRSLVFFDQKNIHEIEIECAQTKIPLVEKPFGQKNLYFLEKTNEPNDALIEFLALKKFGIKGVIQITESESLVSNIKINDLIIINDYFDHFDETPTTFTNASLQIQATHCYQQNSLLKYLESKLIPKGNINVHKNICLACTNDQRLLTQQEKKILRTSGCQSLAKNILGYPYLSNQIGIGYCHIGITTSDIDANNHSPKLSSQHGQILNQLLSTIALYPLPYFTHQTFKTKPPFNALTQSWLNALKND